MGRAIVFVLPGRLDERIGGHLYDRRMVEGLRALGREVQVRELDIHALFPDEATRAEAAARLGALPEDAQVVVDHTALPLISDQVDRLPAGWIALVHHPLALESGLDPDQAAALSALERRLLAKASHIVVPSARTGRDLAALDLPPERITVVRPGTDPAPLARGSGASGRHLLCVGTLTTRKGHLTLIEALAKLQALRWRLTCVGSTEYDPHTVQCVRSLVERHGLGDRIAFAGERDPSELGAFYDQADLVVLASRHEGYGIALAEALAHGIPVVATNAGAIPETVPREAGILVPPDDPDALALALREVLTDDGLQRRLRAGAEAARQQLPRWDEAVAAFAAVLERL